MKSRPLNDPSPSEGADDENTRRILALVRSDAPVGRSPRQAVPQGRPVPAAHSGHDEAEEHEEHIDERWLVSYADMMTLLFGLFVMLYSMSGKFDQVQQSIQKEFNPQEQQAAQAPTEKMVPEAELLKVQKELQTAQTELAAARTELAAAKDRVAQLETANEALQKQVTSLEAKIAQLEEQLRLRPKDRADITPEKLKKLMDENQGLRTEVVELKRRIELLNQRKMFMAIVLQWGTQSHDLDLIVKDPKGHVYDFKNRKFSGSQGELTLDTRQGPGTEVWQTEQLAPGRYEITAIFYNAYGNRKPASMNVSVFTPQGTQALPAAEIAGSGRKHSYAIEVSAEGKVRVVP